MQSEGRHRAKGEGGENGKGREREGGGWEIGLILGISYRKVCACLVLKHGITGHLHSLGQFRYRCALFTTAAPKHV